jgi:hypothetical protein
VRKARRSGEERMAVHGVEKGLGGSRLNDTRLLVPVDVVAVEVVAKDLLGGRGVRVRLEVGVSWRSPLLNEALDRLVLDRASPRATFSLLPLR